MWLYALSVFWYTNKTLYQVSGLVLYIFFRNINYGSHQYVFIVTFSGVLADTQYEVWWVHRDCLHAIHCLYFNTESSLYWRCPCKHGCVDVQVSTSCLKGKIRNAVQDILLWMVDKFSLKSSEELEIFFLPHTAALSMQLLLSWQNITQNITR